MNIAERQNAENLDINREKICPFLVRVYFKVGDFNNLDDFNAGIFPKQRELYIYTWMDASLREITMLIKDTIEACQDKETVLNYSFVFPDTKGKLIRKEVGYVYANKFCNDESKTLQQLKFTIGDYIDISIQVKNN
jgi:histone deacetylase complex subunit SAP18